MFESESIFLGFNKYWLGSVNCFVKDNRDDSEGGQERGGKIHSGNRILRHRK